MFAEAANSRYLYKGYRYETAAAGRWDNAQSGVAARQGGSNFTGQHYTLFRHFDPSLMRFTSLDPLASSSNLFAYCENNPHGSYDPDGLESEAGSGWFIDFGGYWNRAKQIWSGQTLHGYGGRAAVTWDAAKVGVVDLATLGQYYDEADRTAQAERWKGNEFYAGAGYGVAQATVLTALTVATAGYASAALGGAGFAANVGSIGLMTWTGAGAVAGAWGGAASAGIAGGGAGDMAIGGAIGAAEGAITTLLTAGAFKLAGVVGRTVGRLFGRVAGRLKDWHIRMNGKYEWKNPPGKSWLEGMSHKLRVSMGAKSGQELHHWLIPRNQWGKLIPNYIKNRAWNMVVAADRASHARIDTAFRAKGVTPYSLLTRPFRAMPTWARIGYIGSAGAGGYGAYKLFNEED